MTAVGATAFESYEDPFLAAWINPRLGVARNRPVLLLHVRLQVAPSPKTPPATAMTAIAGIIERFGGDAVHLKGGQMIGAWGLDVMMADDPKRALAAALDVVRLQTSGAAAIIGTQAAQVSCLLHAERLDIAKGAAAEMDDALAAAFAGLPTDDRATRVGPDAILASNAFRTVSGWAGAIPISIAGFESGAPPFFALPAPGRDSLDDEGVAHGTHDSPARLTARLDAMGDLKPVLMAAAIAGSLFSAPLLARIIETEPARLAPALAALCGARMIRLEPRPAIAEFAFCDDRMHQTAYQMVPSADRLRLHRRAAEAVDFGGPADPQPTAAVIARHHQLGQDPHQSKRWFSKAAWQSIAAGDTGTAVTYLQTALAGDGEAGDVTPLNRALLHLLGVQQAVMKGNGSNAVFEAYQRSIALAGQTATLAWGQEFRAMWLAQSCHVVKGEIRAALTIGKLLMIHLNRQSKRAETALGRRVLAHRMQALTLMLAGQLKAALSHYDTVLENYVAAQHAMLRFSYGSDQAALSHAHRAWVLTMMGEEQAAAEAERSARAVAERLAHPHTSAHVMAVSALRLLMAGAYGEAVLAAHETRVIALEHGFEYWVPWADVVLAADLARSSPRAGYEMLETAMAAYRATDANQLCPMIYAMLSSAALGDGRARLALQQADAGLLLVAQNGCLLYRPELLRARARALFAAGDHARAQLALEDGYDDACRSGAVVFAANIVRDGMAFGRGQQQIAWYVRGNGTEGCGHRDPAVQHCL